MSQPESERPKWSKEKVFLFGAGIVLFTVGLPLLVIFYVIHKLSQI